MLFEERLKKKVHAVLSQYKSKIDTDASDVEIEEKYKELFKSMKRWHRNSHVSRDEWKAAFEKIKPSLDVRGKLLVPTDLKLFLSAKFAKTNIKDKFNICELLDFLVDDIRQYLMHLNSLVDDDEEEEFDIFHISSGVHPDDIPFFEKSFLPVALFNTYSEIHPNSSRKALMNDVFSIGAGSKTEDLFPEVTALCCLCAVRLDLSNVFDTDQINKKILKEQISGNFRMPVSYDSSDSEVDMGSCEASEVFKLDNGQFWYNPFSASSDESDLDLEELLLKNDSDGVECMTDVAHKCNLCTKSFSREEFLTFHKGWFHKIKISYIDEGNELMKSFADKPGPSEGVASKMSEMVPRARRKVAGAIPSKPAKKTATKAGSRKSVRKVLKY